jgi:predicted unusual protein kinase regulating ubiquinone biosynthesis (AarF/ABC1/UbiB family)
MTMLLRCLGIIYALYAVYHRPTDKNVARTKAAASRCGAVGLKLLQFLVSIDGIFADVVRDGLADVFDACECHSWADTLAMYREDFGHDLHDDFVASHADTEVRPIGSGSIGQVYKLLDRWKGKHVAVKVKHPDIDNAVHDFVRSISWLVDLIEYFAVVPFMFLIKEFISNVRVQLDYCEEAASMEKMGALFVNEDHIIIPEVLYNSSRFIVMTYHDGIPYNQITDDGLRLKISSDLYLFMLSSMLVHDFIHCDLHVGNWKAVQSACGYNIIVYDYGLVTSTGSLALNKRIVTAMHRNDLVDLAEVMMPTAKSHKRWPALMSYISELQQQLAVNNMQKIYTAMVRKASTMGIPFNVDIIRAVQGLNICDNILNVSRKNVMAVLGDTGDRREVILCYNSALLEKIGKYADLKHVIDSWIDEDPKIRRVFDDWLFDTFGHRDASVVVDIIVDGAVF